MPKKNKEEIITAEQAKKAMQQLNKYNAALAQLYRNEASDIEDVRIKHHSGGNSLKRRALENLKQDRERQLQQWADKARREWKGKSLKTPFGTLGFRKGQPKVQLLKKVSKNWDQALGKIKEHLPKFIRRKDEINKELILEDAAILTREQLQEVGITINQEETFVVKTLCYEQYKEAVDKLKSA